MNVIHNNNSNSVGLENAYYSVAAMPYLELYRAHIGNPSFGKDDDMTWKLRGGQFFICIYLCMQLYMHSV